MSFSGNAFRLLMSLVPRHNKLLFIVACFYRDRYRAENDVRIAANGELRLLQTMLPACKVVFDVGAHVGDWTQLALQVSPQAHIHCFEPCPQSHARIAARAFPGNVVVNNIALGAAGGQRKLFAMARDSSMNSLYRLDGTESKYGPQQEVGDTIDCATTDDYCSTHSIDSIDFMKVDVEGSEMDVLRGARSMLARRAIRVIQFEHTCCAVASRTLLADFFDFLLPFGYSLYKVHPRGLWRLPTYDVRLETFDYANYVAALDLDAALSAPHPSWQ